MFLFLPIKKKRNSGRDDRTGKGMMGPPGKPGTPGTPGQIGPKGKKNLRVTKTGSRTGE